MYEDEQLISPFMKIVIGFLVITTWSIVSDTNKGQKTATLSIDRQINEASASLRNEIKRNYDLEDRMIQQCYYVGGHDLADQCFDKITGRR